jgi:hypothetical protein
MQGLVAGAGQAGIAFIDLDAGISLALGRKGIGGSCTYLRYIPSAQVFRQFRRLI